VDLAGDPDIVWSQPPVANRCSVAVQTKGNLFTKLGAHTTAIALVLDCSGSMANPATRQERGSKFDNAVAALERVLEELPDGVTVSLHALGDFGGQWVKRVWEPHEWVGADLKTQMAKVRRLRPEGTTPIMRGIFEAYRDLPPKPGRTIVVLTDGVDNFFYHPDDLDRDIKARANGATTMQELLANTLASERTPTNLIVIGYAVSPADFSDSNRAQREAEERAFKDFQPAVQAIGGDYFNAGNSQQMEQLLRRSLLNLPFRVVPEGKVRDAKGDYISQTDNGENLRWVKVDEGAYDVRLPAMPSSKQDIFLRPGDSLLLDLERGPRFRRALYSRSELVRKPSWFRDELVSGWVLASLKIAILLRETA
jgi:hypothetical protein